MKQLEIKSKDNPKIKFLRQLGQKKYRDEAGKFLVENAVIIADASRSGVSYDSLFVTKEFIEKNKERFQLILNSSGSKEYYLIDEKINRSVSSLDAAPGIMAVYPRVEPKRDPAKPVVYLNAINDPGNLGTILRSALAFELKNIVVDEKCADIYNPKTIQAAKDAIFKLNIDFDRDREVLEGLKKKIKIYVTRLERSATPEILKKEKIFCLVLGSEAHGVDKAIQDMADGFIKIEMSDEIESLNVASAAAIIFYEIYKYKKTI